MPLQTKRTDELSKQFDDLFVMPEVKDDQKDRFLGKKEEEQLKQLFAHEKTSMTIIGHRRFLFSLLF